MTITAISRRQYQRIADAHAAQEFPRVPSEGWLRTVRKALGMPGAQLATKMGVTRARVAQAESAELTGGITLKSMQATAEAMGCRFVYAIVPEGRIDDLITAQAQKKATAIVRTASQHMALESQVLSNEKMENEVTRLTREIAQGLAPDFWSDP
jgi:predicted DNA-binding mobile mystery protein A